MTTLPQFHGIITALITPFKNGDIDGKSFQEHVEWQISEGVHGLVPSGTTGESPTLNHEEHAEVIRLCVEQAKGRVPVIAGTGSNSTREAISLTKDAEELGADAALLVAPYYNKPTAEGLYAHFKAVNDAVNIPIILYNIPGRSIVNMSDELIAKLGELKNIVGVKDATGDLARVSTLRMAAGHDFIQLSGEDMTALAFNSMGGVGCISVSSNIAPRLCAELQNATLKGDYAQALRIQNQLAPLHDIMFCESSPAPAKYAAHLMGKCEMELRRPLVGPSDANKARIKAVLEELRLI